jgi:hypothetical protein
VRVRGGNRKGFLAPEVLVLLLLDPTRPLALVFVLLTLAVACAIAPAILDRVR